MVQSDKREPGKDGDSIPTLKKFSIFPVLYPAFFIIASFLIYQPVISRYFVSDDFKVLYRVCTEHIIFIKGFFRPLSDLSILLNYQFNGLDNIIFNAFNILIHGINSYLVYLCCLNFGTFLEKNTKTEFAIISSCVFLCYPFHNEAVVWLLGRGASMACMFSLLSILSYYKIKSRIFKFWWVSFFYFISMSAFESTVFFPAIMILVLIFEKESNSSIRKWSTWLLLTLVFHLLIRYWIAGSILGSYGGDFFHSGARTYLLNIAKVCGRLILPPSKNEIILLTFFTLLTVLTVFSLIITYRKLKQSRFAKSIQLFLGMLTISCVIPVIAGISTQTSESDRLLYFPSVFLCFLVGMFVGCGIHNLWSKRIIVLLILSYNLFFLEENNRNWRKASSITQTVLEKSAVLFRNHVQGIRVYFINLPDEINGAFVFRHGFPEALRLRSIDGSCFIPVNYLLRADMEKINEKQILNTADPEINFPPYIKLKYASTGCEQIFDTGKLKFITSPGDLIYFWNYSEMDSLKACATAKKMSE